MLAEYIGTSRYRNVFGAALPEGPGHIGSRAEEGPMADAPAHDEVLDAKGLLCPMPIVKLAKFVKTMDPQKVVLLEATDPGSVPDVNAWAKNTGNPVIHQETVDKVMRFWIQKA